MNFDTNLGSLSLIIFEGSPNLGKICHRNSSATPSAIMVSLQGVTISIFVQLWSVMVRIESNPSDSGSFTIKSMVMVWNGSASVSSVMGDKGAFHGWVFTLFLWHLAHPLTYS